MSFTNQTQTNTTAGIQRQELVGLVIFSIVTTLPCCIFLCVNGIMLFTLRSKPVFRETSRYIFLFNLLFAETLQLTLSQVLYLVSAMRAVLLYAVCCVLTAINSLLHIISPLTLVVMCLERYVAVCFPLRHAAIVTVRNTGVAIFVVWTISTLNFLTQLNFMLDGYFDVLQHMTITGLCSKDNLLIDPVSQLYDKGFTYFLFVLAGGNVFFTYFGIIVAAKSVSTDKASANKACKTLLLHLVQLCLSMFSTLHTSLLSVALRNLDKVLAVTIRNLLYISLIIAPKCLSSLIYGLRDQTIRPVLMLHLSCQCRVLTVISVKSTNTRVRIPSP